MWLGHDTVTGAELYQSAAHWGFMSELSDPDRPGEYQGAAQLGGTLGLVVVATLGMATAARSAERYLARETADQPA